METGNSTHSGVVAQGVQPVIGARNEPEIPYGSNEIRLSLRQWIIVLVTVLAVLFALPRVWKAIEPFEPGSDYRIPNAVSNDYWVYERLIEKAMAQKKIVVIGDSVIWGEYVAPDQTLSHALNEGDRDKRFVNGGVNGTHPLALEGLVRHYARNLTDARVILHCNLLWMSSPERDLQTRQEISFNHPRLLPQVTRRIPAYQASVSRRLGVVFDRRSRFRTWVQHLRVAWFESLDLHTWTIEHPYENPLGQISRHLPQPSSELRHQPISWRERGIDRQDLPWIELDASRPSLQWEAFKNTVVRLKERRNHLFVVVGPFNEHMLTDASRKRYGELTQRVNVWLRRKQILHTIPPLLPSDEYADASHPLSAGYTRLAGHIRESPSFQRWLTGD